MRSSASRTGVLEQLRGDREALDQLVVLLYDELRHIAHRRRMRDDAASLATTALVHEAYLKLVDQSSAQWNNREGFDAPRAQKNRLRAT